MKTMTLFKGLILGLIILQSCSKDNVVPYNPVPSDMTSLKHRYNLAVIDAKTAEPWEIYRSLIGVIYYADSTAGEANLVWSKDQSGNPRLLVTSWMSQSSTQYWPVNQTFTTSKNPAYVSWVTAAPEMLDFLKKNKFTDSASLHLRIAQVLGMPPDTKNNFFVEYWVYPKKMFRPTPDPEIDDHEANLYFPSWASQTYRNWFNNEILNKYDTTKTSAFPWTRLGYTYDWADPSYPVGLSEFVVDTNALVTVRAVYSSWQYYQLSLTKK